MLLSPKAEQTVSQALAEAEERTLVESRLWQRIVASCKEAGLPMDEEAPDFVCAATVATPTIGVFRIASEPNEAVEDEDDDRPSSPFGSDEEE